MSYLGQCVGSRSIVFTALSCEPGSLRVCLCGYTDVFKTKLNLSTGDRNILETQSMAPWTLAHISEEFTGNGITKTEKTALSSAGAFPVGLALGGAVQTKCKILARLSQNVFFLPVAFGTLGAVIVYNLHERGIIPRTRNYRR